VEIARHASDAVYTSAITGGTAIISSLLGYGAARAQHLMEARKLETQETAADRTARETARLERQALYLTYLAKVDALRPMLLPAQHGKPTMQEVIDWWEGYVDTDRQIELAGGEEVRQATGPVYGMLNTITEWDGAADDPAGAIRTRLLEEHWEEFNTARVRLITMMRADAGPPFA
jgi:hypothetical protein